MKALVVVMLAAGLGALAQGPPPGPGGPGRGRMGFGGPGDPGARFIGFEAGMPGRVVKNAPYAAELVTESVQTLADGNHLRQTSTVKVYRDSEGRTRREQSVNLNGLGSNANMPHLVFINDPVAGVNYSLNARDHTGAKSSWRQGGGGRMGKNERGGPQFGRRGAQDGNLKTESLGRQTMEGVQVEGRRVTTTIPAGQIGNDQPLQIVAETWYSPDLQTMVLSKRSDPRSGETVTRMTNISRTEPARTLFEAPADYTITESQGRMRSTR
ncbi:MAG TPA: hypothetical protein VMJ75_17740 [Candidatus Acidoferrales bacterium]|nr:hypothetical protein [Candidatus Acidoferrales bacterium]